MAVRYAPHPGSLPTKLRAVRNAFSIALLLLLGISVRAQTSYELADGGFVATQVPEPGSAEAELADARRLIAQDDPKRASKALDVWLKAHPQHPLRAEALLLRGDARVAAGDFYKSLFDYETIVTYYPATEQFNVALQREFEVATRFTQGVKRRLWGRRWLPAGDDGAELLIRIQERAPGSELGERASMALSDYYFDDGQMDLAAEAYDLFLQNYPRSEQRSLAMLRGVQASLAQFKGPAFDATGLIDAQERLRRFESEFPAAAERVGAAGLRVRIRESLARRDLTSARWYDRTGRRVSAVVLYRRLLEEYPDTDAGGQAAGRLTQLGETVVTERPVAEEQ